MYVYIDGGTRKQRELFRKFGDWLAQELLGKRLSKNIVIFLEIKLSSDMGGEIDGSVGYMGTHPPFWIYHFDIAQDQSKTEFLTSIAHEFVHIKQFRRKEYVQKIVNGIERQTWKGRDHTKTPYDKQPWEKEAYRMQDKLVRDFLNG